MKIEKLELNCDKIVSTLDLSNNQFKTGAIIADVKIPLNQKIIKSWVAGMSAIEKESFHSILAEFMIKEKNK